MGLGLESVSEMTSTMHFITWEESGVGWGWFGLGSQTLEAPVQISNEDIRAFASVFSSPWMPGSGAQLCSPSQTIIAMVKNK